MVRGGARRRRGLPTNPEKQQLKRSRCRQASGGLRWRAVGNERVKGEWNDLQFRKVFGWEDSLRR
jgi:hypothetical protein